MRVIARRGRLGNETARPGGEATSGGICAEETIGADIVLIRVSTQYLRPYAFHTNVDWT